MAHDSKITQFYLPSTHEPYLPLLPSHRVSLPLSGTQCSYPWRDGQAELSWMAGYILKQISQTRSWTTDKVTHPCTNQTWHRVTSLTDSNALQLSQTTTKQWNQWKELFCHIPLLKTWCIQPR